MRHELDQAEPLLVSDPEVSHRTTVFFVSRDQCFAAHDPPHQIISRAFARATFTHCFTYVSTLLSTWTRSLSIRTNLRYYGLGRMLTKIPTGRY